MTRRPVVPLLILGLLGVLSVGAVVLGLAMAPSTPDLLVHNGSGELVYAPSLTFLYSSSNSRSEYIKVVYTAPDQATESLLTNGPNGPAARTIHVKGPKAVQALDPFAKMQTITGFRAKGSGYLAQLPASTLYTAERAPLVKGSVSFRVALHGGYLVDLLEAFDVHTPAGTQAGTNHYRVTSIDGQPVPSS